MMKEQVFAQAALLAGELDERQLALLKILCDGAVAGFLARLRENVTEEDYGETLAAAASLYAVAQLRSAEAAGVEEFRAGDLTVKRGTASGGSALGQQAERLMKPYLKDSFSFQGV